MSPSAELPKSAVSTSSPWARSMLRLDPGDERILRPAPFASGRAAASTTSPEARVATSACAPRSSPRSPTTDRRLVEDLILQGGVDLG